MIDDVLDEPYQFLAINMTAPWATRFRKGLGEVVPLDSYKGLTNPQHATDAPLLDAKK